jgi:hypothetical protein
MDEVEMKEDAPLSFLNYCKCDTSMVGKFDTYLTYITSDFREEKSLEQEVEAFLDIYGRKGNAAITSDKYQIFPPFHFVIYMYELFFFLINACFYHKVSLLMHF